MGMDPAYAKHHADIEQQTAAFVQARQEARTNGAQMQPVVVTIPVVFHVVYANSTKNIPDERLFEQLQILNDDFRRMNADQDNIPPQAADTEIDSAWPPATRTAPVRRNPSRAHDSQRIRDLGQRQVLECGRFRCLASR